MAPFSDHAPAPRGLRGSIARRPRLGLGLSGGVFGLLLGLGYWFLWGCTRCAKDNSPYAVVAFFVVCGAGMALSWGRDHLPPPVL